MSWRRAAIYWACFLALVVYYVAVEREPAGQVAAHLTRAAFLDVPEERVIGLEIRRGAATVRCRRVEGRWQVVEPAGSGVPSDLVAGVIGNLTQLPDVEVVAEAAHDLTEFGLDAPPSQYALTLSTGQPISVRLGSRNPAGTAVYAQRSDSNQIFLIGLNVRYYEDLLFESLRPGT